MYTTFCKGEREGAWQSRSTGSIDSSIERSLRNPRLSDSPSMYAARHEWILPHGLGSAVQSCSKQLFNSQKGGHCRVSSSTQLQQATNLPLLIEPDLSVSSSMPVSMHSPLCPLGENIYQQEALRASTPSGRARSWGHGTKRTVSTIFCIEP